MIRTKINQMLNFLSCTTEEKDIIFRTSRLIIYFFILLFEVLILWKVAKQYNASTFSEHGPIENCQLVVLAVTSLLFLKDAIRNKEYRPLLLFLSSLTLFATIREQDHFFEKIFPVISWKFAWLFPLTAVYYAFKKRAGLKKIFFFFLNSSAFQLMFMAMIVFIPVAQCIGHRSFIANAVGSSENLIFIRRMIEESTELTAYLIILLSSIEMHLSLKKRNQ